MSWMLHILRRIRPLLFTNSTTTDEKVHLHLLTHGLLRLHCNTAGSGAQTEKKADTEQHKLNHDRDRLNRKEFRFDRKERQIHKSKDDWISGKKAIERQRLLYSKQATK